MRLRINSNVEIHFFVCLNDWPSPSILERCVLASPRPRIRQRRSYEASLLNEASAEIRSHAHISPTAGADDTHCAKGAIGVGTTASEPIAGRVAVDTETLPAARRATDAVSSGAAGAESATDAASACVKRARAIRAGARGALVVRLAVRLRVKVRGLQDSRGRNTGRSCPCRCSYQRTCHRKLSTWDHHTCNRSASWSLPETRYHHRQKWHHNRRAQCWSMPGQLWAGTKSRPRTCPRHTIKSHCCTTQRSGRTCRSTDRASRSTRQS
jgi:hypothetical protein